MHPNAKKVKQVFGWTQDTDFWEMGSCFHMKLDLNSSPSGIDDKTGANWQQPSRTTWQHVPDETFNSTIIHDCIPVAQTIEHDSNTMDMGSIPREFIMLIKCVPRMQCKS